MKITYYVASSLDGFIARENGDVSWLDELDIDMEQTGYDAFFASVDGLVMGRNTYDFIFNYGSWPYEDRPAWVCTSTDIERLPAANINLAKTVDEVVKAAKEQGLQHLWLVGGGQLASSFLDRGLISHLSIAEMPITLQSGIKLFSGHRLDRLATSKIEKLPKKGFTQLEITL